MEADSSRFAVRVLENRCKSCGYCAAFCPKGVFVPSGRVNDEGYATMTPSGVERCIGCMRCVTICPDFALIVEPQGR